MSTVTSQTEHSNQANSLTDEQQYIDSIEQQIFSLPIVKELKNDSSYEESRGHERLTEEQSEYHFSAGTLSGKGKTTVRPLVFHSEEKKDIIAIWHVGDKVCGHDGIVHGGFLSTLMDDLLARTTIPFLPDRNGATAYLHVNFRSPCKADQILIGRSKVTKLERRKGYSEGTLENLEGRLIVDANALFISVKSLK